MSCVTQVKIAGKRVDLEEIEGAILAAAHPLLSQVAVTLHNARLTAFMALRHVVPVREGRIH